MTNYCTNCGAILTDSIEKCGNCGTPNPNFNVEATKNANGYDPASSPLIINAEAKQHMSGFASWAKGLSIFGIVCSVLGIIGLLLAFVGLVYVGPRYGDTGIIFVSLLIYAFIIGIALYMAIRSLRGANHFKKALRTGDEKEVAEGFNDFRFYVKAAGITIIILVVIYILVAIIGVASMSTRIIY